MADSNQTWQSVALSAQVSQKPLAIDFGTEQFILVRLGEDAPAVVLRAHCPHRLVPLTAATVVEGTLQCIYHGWRFAADGTCVDLPSMEPGKNISPRANHQGLPAIREADGQVELAALPSTPRARHTEWLTNTDQRLAHGWHPVALSAEVETEPYSTRLLGNDWILTRHDGILSAEPRPAALIEQWGLVWMAPQSPTVELFNDPDEEDREFVGGWLEPARTPASAGFSADNFLDVAHFPFIHRDTFGAESERVVPAYEVLTEPGGFRSIQEQPFDNPEDPGVLDGTRSVHQTRRATYVYRAPFQLMLRLEELEAGATKTILFFAQPEDDSSTRLYTKMLIRGIGGVERPEDSVLEQEIKFEDKVLGEDLALQQVLDAPGLPIDLATELHVRADRLGVALRRALQAFLNPAT